MPLPPGHAKSQTAAAKRPTLSSNSTRASVKKKSPAATATSTKMPPKKAPAATKPKASATAAAPKKKTRVTTTIKRTTVVTNPKGSTNKKASASAKPKVTTTVKTTVVNKPKGTTKTFTNTSTNTKPKASINTKASTNAKPRASTTTKASTNTKPKASTNTKASTKPRASTNKSTGSSWFGGGNNKNKQSTNSNNNNNNNNGGLFEEETPLTQEEQDLQHLLGDGAYHLPGNNWRQDWLQYFGNNHPLFSPCFQHPLHPISKWMRAVQLVGSIMVGLVITNVMFLLFISDSDEPPIFELPDGGGYAVPNGTYGYTIVEEENEIISDYTSIELGVGVAILWTIGSAAHALWDNTVWYVTSCMCCKDSEKQWIKTTKKLCNGFVVIGVIAISALATLIVIIRAQMEGGSTYTDVTKNQGDDGKGVITVDSEQLSNQDNYKFLMSYAVELALAWFIWFPIIETILFSGVLAKCCPCLGGRPAEVAAEEEEKSNKKAFKNSDIV